MATDTEFSMNLMTKLLNIISFAAVRPELTLTFAISRGVVTGDLVSSHSALNGTGV